MKKIMLLVGVMVLMVGCGSRKEKAAFERYMDDLFIETSHIPVKEFNFEITDVEGYPYSTADRCIAELAGAVGDVHEMLSWALIFMDENERVELIMNRVNEAQMDLSPFGVCDEGIYRMDDDSIVMLYNQYRVGMSEWIDGLEKELSYLDTEDELLVGLREDRSIVEGLPMELKRRDVKEVGKAMRFRYEMDVDGYRKVFLTHAVYDNAKDKIVVVNEDELPMGLILKMGIRDIFN